MVIILSRHGESEYNVENRIGGNPSLSLNGVKYAKSLGNFCTNNSNWVPKTCITSTKKRTIETCSYIENYMKSIDQYPELDEINAGVAEDLTYEEFSRDYPIENIHRNQNKLSYRYPNGESYEDLIQRTAPIVNAILTKKKDVFIVAHRAVIRTLIYNFLGGDIQQIPNIDIPLHKIIIIKDGYISLIDIEKQ